MPSFWQMAERFHRDRMKVFFAEHGGVLEAITRREQVSKEVKFKVGDRVRIVRCSMGGATDPHVGKVGRIVQVVLPTYYVDHTGDGDDICHASKVELATPSLDNLQVDDVVISGRGHECTVAAVVGRMVFMEDRDGHADTYCTVKELKDDHWTVKELKDDHWTVKGAEEDDTVELTIEEIAKLKGVPADKIRIKDDHIINHVD